MAANRQKTWLFFDMAFPVVGALAMVLVYEGLHAPRQYLGFVVMGGAMLAFWQNVLWSMAAQFSWDRGNGTLELYVISPTTFEGVLLGMALGSMFTVTLRAAVILVLGSLLFGVTYTAAGSLPADDAGARCDATAALAGHPGLHPRRHRGAARGIPDPGLRGARRSLAALHGVAREKRREAGDAMGIVMPRQLIGYAAAVRLGWAVSSNWTRPILFVTYSMLRPISMALILAVMYSVITHNAAAARPYLAFLIIGTAFWSFIQEGVSEFATGILEDE